MAGIYHGCLPRAHKQCKSRDAIFSESDSVSLPSLRTDDVQSDGLWMGKYCNGFCVAGSCSTRADCFVVFWCKIEDSSQVNLLEAARLRSWVRV